MRKVIFGLTLLLIAAPSCGPDSATLSPVPRASAETGTQATLTEPTATHPILTSSPSASATPRQRATETSLPLHTATTTTPAPSSPRPLLIDGLQARHLIGNPQLGDSFYALAPAGLYLTRDGGNSWAQVTPAPMHDQFVFSPAEPGILYAGAGADCYRGGPDQPLYKSINGGATWRELANGVNFRPVAAHPTDSNRVWAIGCAGPAFSSDGGSTWSVSQDELFLTYDVSQIVPAGDSWSAIYLAGVSEGGSGVVAKSQDGGQSWSPLLRESPERPLWWINDMLVRSLPSTSQPSGETATATPLHQIFLADPHGVWRSRDAGDNWEFSDVGLERVVYQDGVDPTIFGLNALAADRFTVSGTIYLGTAQGIYQSSDGGETWTRLDLADGANWDNRPIRSLALWTTLSEEGIAPPDPRLFITTDEGVYILELKA